MQVAAAITAASVALDLEEAIRDAFLDTRTVIFHADRFRGFGPDEIVLDALRLLVDAGKLHLFVERRCYEGHLLSVELEDVAVNRSPEACPRCEAPMDEDFQLRFEMTAEWQQRVEGGLKKKAAR